MNTYVCMCHQLPCSSLGHSHNSQDQCNQHYMYTHHQNNCSHHEDMVLKISIDMYVLMVSIPKWDLG